jgi:hypothetical protein
LTGFFPRSDDIGVGDRQGPDRSVAQASAISPGDLDGGVSQSGWWRTWVWWIAVLILAFAAGVASFLPPVEAAERWVAAHRAALLAFPITLAGAGLLLLVATLFLLALQGGATRSTADLTEATIGMRKTTPIYSKTVSRFSGKSSAIEIEDSWTAGGMKAAWRTGQWRRDPAWQRRFLASIAILMVVVGVLGIVIVCARAWVALLFGVALMYFLARIVWGFWRA